MLEPPRERASIGCKMKENSKPPTLEKEKKKGRKEGGKEGREGGREEGRKEGRKEGKINRKLMYKCELKKGKIIVYF
jgi:flagellar biosynthesis/type III secretory pathway protein FliH